MDEEDCKMERDGMNRKGLPEPCGVLGLGPSKHWSSAEEDGVPVSPDSALWEGSTSFKTVSSFSCFWL